MLGKMKAYCDSQPASQISDVSMGEQRDNMSVPIEYIRLRGRTWPFKLLDRLDTGVLCRWRMSGRLCTLPVQWIDKKLYLGHGTTPQDSGVSRLVQSSPQHTEHIYTLPQSTFTSL